MKRKTTFPGLLVALIATLMSCFTSNAQPVITLADFSSGYPNPVGIYNCGDDRLFIVEQLGYVFICDLNGVMNNTPFLNIDARVNSNLGEAGLLGMAFHPNYAANGYLYVNYTDNGGNTVISRFTRSAGNPNLVDTTTEFILMSIPQPSASHKGGCMHFGKDGYLYIALGDGGSSNNPAQDDMEKLGKFLRIDVNNGNPYAIPSSNPYYGNAAMLQETWAEGLRNPWRWSFDSYTGDMWMGDVGQGLYEEINYQAASAPGGANYGWRCYEGNHVYNISANCPASSTITYPVFEYTHSATSGCSVTGGFVYRGGINGELYGKYMFSDFCSGKMRMIEKTGATTFVETDLNDTPDYEIVSFGEDKYGELYVCNIGSWTIKKLSSGGCEPTAFIKSEAAVSLCPGAAYLLDAVYGNGLTYKWYRNNVLISGASANCYTATTGGTYKVEVTKPGGCTATSTGVKLTYTPSATITAGGPTTFCAGGSVILSANTGTGFTYQWKKNGANIAGATTANYTATQAGTYKVKVTNSTGCTKLSSGITTVVNCKMAEQLQTENLTADLIPNPASEFVDITIHALPNHPYTVLIYDMIGKNYGEYKLTTNDENTSSHTIDVSRFDKGVYNIVIQGENKNEYKKLLVQ